MRNLFIFLVGCLMLSSTYGMMEGQKLTANAIGVKVQSYTFPLDVSCVTQEYISITNISKTNIPIMGNIIENGVTFTATCEISEETCKRDFEKLYVTMNDFLDLREKETEDIVLQTFVNVYSIHEDFKKYVDDEIQEFESFIRNASCQVVGHYSEEETDAYIKYLQDRLSILRANFKN